MPIRRSLKQQARRQHSTTKIYTLPTLIAMRECFNRYLILDIANGNASNDTLKIYRGRVSLFLNWCRMQELYPAQITRENILEYRKHLIDSGKTSPTISLSLISIKHFYTACLSKKLVKANPALGVKPPKEKRQVGSTIKYLSEEELQQVFDSVAPTLKIRDDKSKHLQMLRDRVLLACMAIQGCRTIEVHRANWGDLDSSSSAYFLRIDGKNSIRSILLREDVAEAMELYRQARKQAQEKLTSSSPLFISLSNRSYGRRLTRGGIVYIVSKYLVQCNLKHEDLERSLSTHSLRHTAGTLALQNGSSLREVQDLLGHADPKTTAVYTHVLNSQEHNPAARINVSI